MREFRINLSIPLAALLMRGVSRSRAIINIPQLR